MNAKLCNRRVFQSVVVYLLSLLLLLVKAAANVAMWYCCVLFYYTSVCAERWVPFGVVAVPRSLWLS